MERRIENAINVFLDAISNGTLAKGTCEACAVGQLVADACNYKIDKTKWGDENYDHRANNGFWGLIFMSDQNGQQFYKRSAKRHPKLLNELKKTGFSLRELMKIEEAFESNTKILFDMYPFYEDEEVRKDQINGLEAVVKVMLGFNKSNKEDVKEVFTSKAELIPV